MHAPPWYDGAQKADESFTPIVSLYGSVLMSRPMSKPMNWITVTES
jgi:hypothetical protein